MIKQTKHAKISATLPLSLLVKVDNLVKKSEYPNRSALIEIALIQMLRAQMDAKIEAEAAKLNTQAEIAEAEEGMQDYSDIVGQGGTF
ncbi:hypothetical protein THIOM_004257 [Candidatus Thiomargarita nelsonii]|uniref:Ribbon-helix-helix protein CopG domain-containing protein n=1 Tax=Candidatus Thiomargarita nelsonii TaxID=1003181 RepID=A0A0A6NXB6_9GAMM|nr:hypothetical protein THIOM_004257 [Candidatus Thiomargarita nelsonii]